MNPILEILIETKLLRINYSMLNRWNDKGKVESLMYAARNGDANVRLKCAEIFGNYLNFKEVENQLFVMVFDEVEEVSRESIKAIQKSQDAEVHKSLKQRLLEKRNPKRRKRGTIGTSESYYHKTLSQQRSSPLEDQQNIPTGGIGMPGI